LLYAGHRSDKTSFQQAQARLGFKVLPAAQADRCQGKMHAQLYIQMCLLAACCRRKASMLLEISADDYAILT